MSMGHVEMEKYGINNEAVTLWRSGERRVLGVICCHVPEEIIDAAGILPIRIRATGCTEDSEAEVWMSPFSCSFARSCVQYMMDGKYDYLDGIVASDGCLMAGRIFDDWRYIAKEEIEAKDYFMMQFGAPRLMKERSLVFYEEELQDLVHGLEDFTGQKITDEKLLDSIGVYNETRRLIRELYALRKADNPVISGAETLQMTLAAMSMPKREYNRMLSAFMEEAKKRAPLSNVRARLMVIGSAIDDPEYLRVIENTGGLIVADANCFGSRYLWEPLEVEGDVLSSIARAYLGKPTCPRMCNLHDELHDYILRMVKEYKVDGIIYIRMRYCEVWGGERIFFEEKFKDADLPFIMIEREQIMTNAAQLAVRAEAFVEMLEGSRK
jgi:bzd-type benzoyl-CoA reductase N subunit